MGRSLGLEMSRCLDPSTERFGGSTRPIADGIVVGLAAAVRWALLTGKDVRSPAFQEVLTEWALSCACSSLELGALQAIQVRAERERPVDPTFPPGGDLTLLHSATAKLAATGAHELLTPRRICAAAGVSRRSFAIHFSGIDECLVAVAVQRVDLVLEYAHQAGEPEPTPQSRAFRRLVELCGQIACDPGLAYLCFGDAVKSGEWLTRRDRLLTKRMAGLFESAGVASYSVEQPKAEASLGAVLGLLQHEVAAGRTGCAQSITPALAYLMLAPAVGRSSAIEAICKQR
jgi:AcrR family transcriptional regulator